MQARFLIHACSLVLIASAMGQSVSVSASSANPSSPNISGLILLSVSAACPSWTTEVAALNGKFLQGTVAANGDAGTSGGNATITPSGTVTQPTLSMNAYTPTGGVAAPVFTGNAGTVPAEVFAGSSATTSAVSAGTPAGTNSTVSITPLGSNAATATSGNCAATNIAQGTSTANACKATAPNLTVPAETFTGSATTVGAETFTGSALGAHTHTVTATGTNGTVAFTPAGTNSAPVFTGTQATLTGSVSQPTFSGLAIDPRPQFVRVIFCAIN